jgi:hypothetical protein
MSGHSTIGGRTETPASIVMTACLVYAPRG